MTLSLRLSLIITFVFVLSIVVGLGRAVIHAQEHVRTQLDVNAEFTQQMLSLLLEEKTNFAEAAGNRELLERLESIKGDRYIYLHYEESGRDVGFFDAILRQGIDAPEWFVNLVFASVDMPVQKVALEDGTAVSIGVDPSRDVESVWAEARETMIVRFSANLLLNIVAFSLLRYWLQPTDGIIEVLGDVERGDFSRRAPTMKIPELNRIAEQINHLTSILGAGKAENERLTRTSLTIQEQERRHMAQELHDSLGQSLSAIKAIAVSIAQSDRGIDAVSVSSALKIEQISDTAYSSVRKMMRTLRPPVLDELGLVPSLNNMVDEWNDHHEETFCRLRIDGSFNDLQDEQVINIYRIVQEALTNIAKHANAENVALVLSGGEVISISINDDGQGYDPTRVERGMGLMGLRERVQALQGELTIFSRLNQGVDIQIEFPRIIDMRRRAGDS